MEKSHQFEKLLYCKETGILHKFYIDYDHEGKKIKREKIFLNFILPFCRQSNLKSAMINTQTIVEAAEDIANSLLVDTVGYGYHQYKICETYTEEFYYRHEILGNSELIKWREISIPQELKKQLNECE
jgi:hypothetical protein